MEIEFLGTGAGVPAKQRNVTSIALKLLDERNAVWLFDCGEGTQQQILRTHIKPRKIEKIFISHLHGDHIFGLPGLVSSRSFQGGEEPLTIYGPKGIKDFVMMSLKVSETHLAYPLNFVEITEGQEVFADQQFRVTCLPLEHRIKSFGYRIEEADYPGELQVEKLKADNIPSGPIYGKIKNGENVILPDGRTIQAKYYVGAIKKGRIVTILGDTRRVPNSIKLAEGADVLVHESTFSQSEQKMAHAYYHSTSTDAAKVAQTASVKQLLLTHISARYLGKMAQQLQTEAAQIFSNVKVVKDFDEFSVPFEKKS